ncbi:MAG TPA: hypothetical protein VFK27_02815, partial [Bacillales bacterium]|nr:hypothetical protein [Bacillales bacterium]
VVVFGNNAVIKGTVAEGTIVIDGDLTITPSAKVHGLVLVIGGNVHQQAGAKVSHDVLTFSFGKEIDFGLLLAGVLVLSGWLVKLGLSLLFLILSVTAGMLLRRRQNYFIKPVIDSPGKLLLIGAITAVLFTAVELLLVISVIGIPVAVILLLLPFVFFFIGFSTLADMAGKKMVWRDDQPVWVRLFFGSFMIVAVMNIPLVGGLLFLGLIWFSLGLMILWVNEFIKKRRTR